MPTTATTTWQPSNKLTPAFSVEDAEQVHVALADGTYVAGQIISQLTATPGKFASYLPTASYSGAASEVNTLTITATGGSYQLDILGELTPNIAFNAVQATIQTAVNAALAAIPGAGTITVSGTGPFVFTFGGAWANQNEIVIEPVVTGLTGGGATMVNTTPGASGAPTDGTAKAGAILEYACTVSSGLITMPGEWSMTATTAPIYTRGYFYTSDLTGLDAKAIADLGGRLIYGVLGTGTPLFYF